MKAAAVTKQRVGRQHRDYTQRPDNGVIWLHELVIDPNHPERVPAIKISRATLRKNIKLGLFPKPVIDQTGWRLGAVRAWIRRRDALEPPTPDSGQTTAKLFCPTAPGTPGSNIGSVRRVRKPGATSVTASSDATPLDVPLHDQVDAGGQLALAQVESGPATDAAPTESKGSTAGGESCDVRLLLRSIAGATA